jgi:hypothetical protein
MVLDNTNTEEVNHTQIKNLPITNPMATKLKIKELQLTVDIVLYC